MTIKNTFAIAGYRKWFRLWSARCVSRYNLKLDCEISLSAFGFQRWIMMAWRALVLTHLNFEWLREVFVKFPIIACRCFDEIIGVDDTSSGGAKWNSFMILFALRASWAWIIRTWGVKNAFCFDHHANCEFLKLFQFNFFHPKKSTFKYLQLTHWGWEQQQERKLGWSSPFLFCARMWCYRFCVFGSTESDIFFTFQSLPFFFVSDFSSIIH